ncbi:hypothetical protein ACQPW1_09185 [Nocardia sp. CA-128927]|uniref:hypothetical protein n=1 Tax=Nocardia sp. CA-128927 TaxID=3239975 RepID=UPI003D96F04D
MLCVHADVITTAALGAGLRRAATTLTIVWSIAAATTLLDGAAVAAPQQTMRTLVVKHNEMTCFSTKPVAVPTTRAAVIAFHCLPSDSRFTKQLEREAKDKVVKELANKRVDIRLRCTADADAVASCR